MILGFFIGIPLVGWGASGVQCVMTATLKHADLLAQNKKTVLCANGNAVVELSKKTNYSDYSTPYAPPLNSSGYLRIHSENFNVTLNYQPAGNYVVNPIQKSAFFIPLKTADVETPLHITITNHYASPVCLGGGCQK